MCKDGQQLCSRRMLGLSDFLWKKAEKMGEFGNALKFDYTKFSWSSVKLFLDCLHLIEPGPIDVATILECIDFAQFEGKTTYKSFELELVKRLMACIMKTDFPVGTELLISAYLSHVDNLENIYQSKVARKLTKESVSFLIYDFDIESTLNKRLISMCIAKHIFADSTHRSVVYSLMMYGIEIQELEASDSTPKEASETLDDNFIPDPQSVRYLY